MSKVKRKMLSVIMTVAMLTTLFAGLTIVSSAYTATGTMTQLWNNGNPSNAVSGSYYSISSDTELGYFRDYVNAGKNTSSVTFFLTDNIDLNNTSWNPIGYHGRPFNGIFDGQGHAVLNLYINTSTGTHKGLFGSTGSGSIVQNVGVTGSVTAYRYEGGISGYNDGTIQCCYNEASITGNDSGTRGAGGIAGVNGGSIISCYNKGTVYNAYRPAGGIAGIFDADKSGGMYITNCYNVGSVSSASDPGWSGAIVATRNNGTISDCYYLTGTGPGVGYGSSSGTTAMTESDMKKPAFVTTLGTNIWKAVTNDYPVLKNDQNHVTISMTSGPNTTTYNAGQSFSTAGIIIETDTNVQITNYSVSITGPLTVNDDSVIISGTYNTTAYSFTIPITVNPTLTGSVYLNGTATSNGNGTLNNPFNNLTDAINAATYNALGITVKGTVSLTSAAEIHSAVTFVRASGMTGPMFVVAAGTDDVVELTDMTIQGGNTGTLFNVTSGTLQLRGNIKLKDCSTAVYVDGGTVEVNRANIIGSSKSINLHDGTLIIDNYGTTSITGQVYINAGTTFNYSGSGIVVGQTVYLNNTDGASDACITLTEELTTDLTIECAHPVSGNDTSGTRVAQGEDGDIISSNSVGCFHYGNHTFNRTLNGSPRYVYIET